MMRRPRRSPLFPCTTLSRSPPPAVQMQAGLAPCTWAGSLMPEETSFAVFLDRIRAGDEQAAVELVRQYEPVIRREVRLRLHDPRLYRAFDSTDNSPSRLTRFFVRAAAAR